MAVPLRDIILKLPISERLQVAEDIWNSVAADHPTPEDVPLTPAQQQELNVRLAAYQRDPTAGSSWEDVQARIRARHRFAE